MLADEAMESVWQPVVDMEDDSPQGCSEGWITLALEMCIEMSANFHMRFELPMSSYPYLLLWFVKAPPHVCCEIRRRVAANLLEAPLDTLDAGFSRKLLHLCLVDITAAANDGQCSIRLYNLIHDVSSVWEVDTQDIEGTNSIVKRLGMLAPNMTWDLLAARITIKKTEF